MTVAPTPATHDTATTPPASRRPDGPAPRSAFKDRLAALAKQGDHGAAHATDDTPAGDALTKAIDGARWDRTRPDRASTFSESGLLQATLAIDGPDTRSARDASIQTLPRGEQSPSSEAAIAMSGDDVAAQSDPSIAQQTSVESEPHQGQQPVREPSTTPAANQAPFAPAAPPQRAGAPTRPQPRQGAARSDPPQRGADAPTHLTLTGPPANITVTAAIDRADREDRERLRDRIAAELSRHGHDATAVRVAGLPLTRRAASARKEP